MEKTRTDLIKSLHFSLTLFNILPRYIEVIKNIKYVNEALQSSSLRQGERKEYQLNKIASLSERDRLKEQIRKYAKENKLID